MAGQRPRRGAGPGTAALVAALVALGSCGGRNDPPPAPPAETLASIDPRNVGYVTGAVSYPQRIQLPKGAVLEIELLDLSRDGSPPSGALVSEKRFAAGGQVPLRFELPYDRSRIVSGERYGVRARILVDGALWFLNDKPVPVLAPGRPESTDVVVRPARPSE